MNMIKTLVAVSMTAVCALSQAAVVSEGSFNTNFLGNYYSKSSTFDIGTTSNLTFNFDVTTIAKRFVTNDSVWSLTAVLKKNGSNANFGQLSFNSTFSNFVSEGSGAFNNVAKGSGYYLSFSGTDLIPSAVKYSANVAPVPEPETYALMGMGLVGLLAARRRKAKQA